MTKVAVVGFGVIGQRLADAVAAQGDMELVGIADLAPSISCLLYTSDAADE